MLINLSKKKLRLQLDLKKNPPSRLVLIKPVSDWRIRLHWKPQTIHFPASWHCWSRSNKIRVSETIYPRITIHLSYKNGKLFSPMVSRPVAWLMSKSKKRTSYIDFFQWEKYIEGNKRNLHLSKKKLVAGIWPHRRTLSVKSIESDGQSVPHRFLTLSIH